MTQDQQNASSHWSMFGADGFPICKVGAAKWLIVVDPTSLWAVIGTKFPIVFKTKTAAQEFFNNLCLERFKEWRSADPWACPDCHKSPCVCAEAAATLTKQTCDCPIVFPESLDMCGQVHRYNCPNAPKLAEETPEQREMRLVARMNQVVLGL